MDALGRQFLIELYECDRDVLNDESLIQEILVTAVLRAQGTVVSDTFHKFSPHGVSGVVVIAESHVAIHTWPEHGYAAVDVFTCGVSIDPLIIKRYIEEKLHAGHSSSTDLRRGYLPAQRRAPAA